MARPFTIPSAVQSRFIELPDPALRLHYLEVGDGAPLVLLHGWPTSAYLWRNLMPTLAAGRRVLALDLPGFGQSDKPLTASYSFRFFRRVLDGFLDALELDAIDLAVHDLGGPVGLYWAAQQLDRVRSLTLLNTLIYPETSWAVKLFVLASFVPGVKHWLASPAGIAFGMRFGVADKRGVAGAIPAYQAPFVDGAARKALLKAAHGLHPAGMKEIAAALPSYRGPVCAIYGTEDRILPDVARTMSRLQHDLPQTSVSALDGCGHFLQEDQPERVAELMAAFLSQSPTTA
ncbi:MAG: alpha/beta fold hydrolase [Myxococcales bacterium]|nr:alpha/beta fold hydrolase [Myxococcales bacterium]